MKKLVVILSLIVLSGCSWMGQLSDSGGHQLSAYATGRSGYIVVDEVLQPDTVSALEDRYNQLLDYTKGMEIVEPLVTITAINDMMVIIAREQQDPYGVIGDLLYSLKVFGAEFNGEGIDAKMTAVQPVPRVLFLSFSDGWKQSKWVKEHK